MVRFSLAMCLDGCRTIRRQTNSQSVKSQTGQLVD